jgi:hypothetical protein
MIAVKLDSEQFLAFDFETFKVFMVQAALNIFSSLHADEFMRHMRPVEML